MLLQCVHPTLFPFPTVTNQPSLHYQYVGLDIGGTKCAIAHWHENKVVETLRIPTRGFAETYAELTAGIRSLRDDRPVLIGVSCGGPLNSTDGIISCPPNLALDWHGVAIGELLQTEFGGQATLMNDANACALAEWRFGAGQGTRHMIFLTSGTGFGAGLILNGALYEGATGDAGEIGHVRLAADGPIGFGKAGSVEGFCSGGGIARLAELRLTPETVGANAWRDATEPITARRLALAADQGDPFATSVFAEAGGKLGLTLAILIDLFNPECIVLGGFFPKSRHLLEPTMLTTIAAEALGPPTQACRILPAALGDSIGSHGAIAAALHAHPSV